MNITFINQFDPSGNRVGGIGNYIKNFIKYAPDHLTYKIIGVSATLDLYQWHNLDVYGRKVNFLPIVRVSSHNKKAFIPLSLKFSYNLHKFRGLIDSDDYLLCQRNEYVLALSSLKNKKYAFIHSDISLHLQPGISESGWSKLSFLYDFLQKIAFQKVNYIFSVNHNSIKYVCNKIENIDNKISFIHTWADPNRFSYVDKNDRVKYGLELAQAYDVDPQKKRLIFLGRFQKPKNIKLLLSSFMNVKDDCVLFMAGAGDELSFIKNYIHEHSLQNNIILLGNVPHDKIPNLLRSCDIYVSSSHFEGMSIALMEALLSGLYVVTTDTGEARYLLDNDKNGLIVSDFSVENFTNTLKKAIEILNQNSFSFFFDTEKYSVFQSIDIVLKSL